MSMDLQVLRRFGRSAIAILRTRKGAVLKMRMKMETTVRMTKKKMEIGISIIEDGGIRWHDFITWALLFCRCLWRTQEFGSITST